MADWRPGAGPEVLLRRAELLASIRSFFRERGITEVDTPTLSAAAVTDPNIGSLKTHIDGVTEPRYLHTSPEFPMKRLLSAGSGDIYQICKVFRQGEIGRNHNPEFTMLEWYRLEFDHHRLMDEMAELLAAVVPEITGQTELRISYHQAFEQFAGLDADAGLGEIRRWIETLNLVPPDNLSGKNEWLDWIMGACVSPGFPTDRFTFLYDYPADQAALARIRTGQPSVAERFEVFWGELELANGFHELTDADEQSRRFSSEFSLRTKRGMETPPPDSHLIDALRHGLPDCAGVALGIDRLLMACLNKNHISDVMTFGFERA